MAIVGDIKQKKDGSYWVVTEVNPNNPEQYKTEPQAIPDESGAGFFERMDVGLVDNPEKKLQAWQKKRGVQNVRQADNGEIFLLDEGSWKPADESGLSLGDIADESGNLLLDAGSAIGGTVGGAAALPFLAPTLAGIGGGAIVGRNIAEAGRQYLAKDLEDYTPTERATEFAKATGAGALEPLAVMAGGVGEAAGRKAAQYVKPVMQKAGEGAQAVSKFLGGISESSMKAMIDNPELVTAIRKAPDEFVDNTLSKIRITAKSNKKKAGEALGEVAEDIFTRDDAVRVGSIIDEVDELYGPENLHIFGEGVDSTYSTLQTPSERNYLIELRNKIVNAPNALALRKMRIGMDSKIFDHGQPSKEYLKVAGIIRGHIEDALERVAYTKGDDIGRQYTKLKNNYSKAADEYTFIDDYFYIPPSKMRKKDTSKIKGGIALLRNIQGDDKRVFKEAIDQFSKQAPEYADDLNALLIAEDAKRWGDFIPTNKTDIGRGAQATIAAIGGAAAGSNPAALVAGGTYLASRPRAQAVVYPAAIKAGRAATKSMESGLATIGSNPVAQQGVKELARIGARAVMPDPNQTPMGAGDLLASIDLQPIANTVRQSYQGKLVEKMRGGIPEEQAIMEIVQEMAQKNGKAMPSIYQSVADQAGINPSQVQSILRGK